VAAARRPARRRAYRRRLPRLTLGTTALIAILLIAAIRTWPIPATTVGALGATVLVIRAIRPRRRNVRRTRPRPALRRTTSPRTRMPAPRDSRTLATFQNMSADQFEHAIAALARQHPAVRSATVQGGSGDRGVDVLARMSDGRRILVQCKRYRDKKVGGDTLREIVGSVIASECTTGIIVTTSGFTREARDTNDVLGPNRLTLIDGPALVAWANGGHAPWR